VNNWNEKKKNKKQAERYLINLKEDIQEDYILLDEFIIWNEKILGYVRSIGNTLATKQELSKEEEIEFIKMHLDLTYEKYFIPEKRTINQIASSSQGNLITNENLQSKIFKYYSYCEREQQNNEKSMQLYMHHHITYKLATVWASKESVEIIDDSFSGIKRPGMDFRNLSMNSAYFSALSNKGGATQAQNEKYKIMKSMAKELDSLISIELSNY
ncbi:unnamed protein product, partial [Laminaria digitata]